MFANLPFPALMETDRYKRTGGSFRTGSKAAYDDYAKAVSAAHAKAIRHAADGKWPHVLVFEDDAWPRKDARSWIESIISEVNQFGVIALGYTSKKDVTPLTSHLDSGRCYGAQAYVLHESRYGLALAALEKSIKREIKPHADGVLLRYAYKYIKANQLLAKVPLFCQFSRKGDVDHLTMPASLTSLSNQYAFEKDGTRHYYTDETLLEDDCFPTFAEVMEKK